jgi:hypothetical protein
MLQRQSSLRFISSNQQDFSDWLDLASNCSADFKTVFTSSKFLQTQEI